MQKPEVGLLEGFNKVKLFYKFWVVSNPKAHIVFLHGVGEHIEKYVQFAEYFTTQGYCVFMYDMRGHGRSAGTRCHVDKFNEYLLDLDLFIKFINKDREYKKTFIVSHSVGGLVSVLYGLEFPYRPSGIVASSPCLGLKIKINPIKSWLAIVSSRFFSRFSMQTDIKVECATHDKEVIKWVLNDPLTCHRVTTRFYIQLLGAMRYVRSRAEDLTVPVLLLGAGKDMICDPKDTQDFFNDIGSQDKQYKVYPGFYHELLNEIGREQIYKDIQSWIEERCN